MTFFSLVGSLGMPTTFDKPLVSLQCLVRDITFTQLESHSLLNSKIIYCSLHVAFLGLDFLLFNPMLTLLWTSILCSEALNMDPGGPRFWYNSYFIVAM